MKNTPLITLIAILLCTVACDNDGIYSPFPEEEEIATWQRDDRFSLNRGEQYNSFADRDQLLFIGQNGLTTITLEEEQEVKATERLDQPIDPRFITPLSSDIFIVPEEHSFTVLSTAAPGLDGTTLEVDMRRYDPDFTGFGFLPKDQSDAILINTDNELLIPYRVGDQLKLFRMGLYSQNGLNLEILFTNIVEVPAEVGQLNRLFLIDPYFYGTFSDGTYRVDNAHGIARIANEPFSAMFGAGGLIYAFQQNQAFSSAPGDYWTSEGSVESLFSEVRFAEAQYQTIGFKGNELFLVDRFYDDLKLIPLDNEGLENTEINAVSSFNDKVYLSTDDGVFIKSARYFFEEKQ